MLIRTVARRGGFESPILTGTCTIGMGVRHVLDRWAGGDVRRFEKREGEAE